jgi:hypothetical protein
MFLTALQRKDVIAIAPAAAPMAAVAIQPIIRRGPATMNWPIIFLFEIMIIIITMTGTATTPLITALQNNALIGSRGEKQIPQPTNVATRIVP